MLLLFVCNNSKRVIHGDLQMTNQPGRDELSRAACDSEFLFNITLRVCVCRQIEYGV